MAKKDVYICENEYGKKTNGMPCKHALDNEELEFDINAVEPCCPNEKCEQPLLKIRSGKSGGGVPKIGIIAVAGFAILCLLAWGLTQLIAGAPGAISGVPKIVNFGELSTNESSVRFLSVSNKGQGVLKISNVSCSNADFSIEPVAMEIDPGKKAKMKISFSSSNHGSVETQLVIDSNDAEYPQVKVELKSVVTEVDIDKVLDGIMKKSSATESQ